MDVLQRCRRLIFGAKLDPLNPHTRQHIVLVAFLAWIGLGADGLSSACYGPEEAFLALGAHTHMGLYLAAATAATVFIIALAYNQVIELFPSGGGGYKAATRLIGPYAGLVSGSALIVDYVLTITISVASAADALFSLFPASGQAYKFVSELGLVGLLILLNLRGMKESIQVLLPVFLGFFVSHALLIGYGVSAKSGSLGALVPNTLKETSELWRSSGWLFTASLFLRAYSMGGGTYTGIEAVSNNINMLAEPRVRTGHLTMFYMATSLAFTAGGIILLYLLWHAAPVEGQTLNAVTFKQIIDTRGWGTEHWRHAALAVTLGLEGGLLLVAANTGFLGGPAVMANMAADRWVPRQFRQLSSRMVTQNGVLLMGGAALGILLWSRGRVSLLVVLYSINVFLTFSLSLFGLCRHWWEQRRFVQGWLRRLALSGLGLLVTGFILMVTLAEKFTEGGWITILITSTVVAVCIVVRRHYEAVQAAMELVDDSYSLPLSWDDDAQSQALDRKQATAVFLVGGNRGAGMHMLQWVLRHFAGRFRNFVFVAIGEVDKQSYDSDRAIRSLQARIENSLRYFTSYCVSQGYASASYQAYGADPLEELTQLTLKVLDEFPDSVCFASKLMFEKETFWTSLLHNQMPLAMQRRLELAGKEMIIVPVHVPEPATRERMPIT
ncbi:MAG: amino acid permease [Nevskia sp.]|nr:amino acid permease [Nevskia sp.]